MQTKILLSLALLAFCLTAAEAPADHHLSPSAPGASVAFANIMDGDVVPPGFTVRFTVSGMGIAPAGTEVDNTGHYHLLIDLSELPPMDQPLPATEHIVHYGKGQTEAVLDLAEGEHRLQLLLADYAHVPHDPPVISEPITVRISADAVAKPASES